MTQLNLLAKTKSKGMGVVSGVLGMSRNALIDHAMIHGSELVRHFTTREKVELARCETFGTKSTLKMISADRTSTNTH